MAITYTVRTLAGGGAVITLNSDASGGTSNWIPVSATNVGVDLNNNIGGAGTARAEFTACDPQNPNPSRAVATTWAPGTIAAGSSGTSTIFGASMVRLVATGACEMSVRT